MAEPARSDHDIVVQLFPAPIDATPAQIKTHTQYAGKFAQACKLAREDERRKFQVTVDQAVKAVRDALVDAHGKELIAMQLHMDDASKHRSQAAAGKWALVTSAVWLLVCIGAMYGQAAYTMNVQQNAITASTDAQMSAVAAARAMNAPRGLQLPPPDASQQPEWARQ